MRCIPQYNSIINLKYDLFQDEHTDDSCDKIQS